MGGGGGLCLGMVVVGYAVYGGGFVTGYVCVWSGFLFCIFYIDGFFNVILIFLYMILIFLYMILMYRIEKYKM